MTDTKQRQIIETSFDFREGSQLFGFLMKTDSKVVRAGINKSEMTDLKKYKETNWQYIRYCNILLMELK